MDDKLLEHLLEKGVPTFSMSSGLTLDDFGWGSPTFHKMVRQQRPLLAGRLGAQAQANLGPLHGCCMRTLHAVPAPASQPLPTPWS